MLFFTCSRSVTCHFELKAFSIRSRTGDRCFKSTTAAINRGLIRSGRRQEGQTRPWNPIIRGKSLETSWNSRIERFPSFRHRSRQDDRDPIRTQQRSTSPSHPAGEFATSRSDHSRKRSSWRELENVPRAIPYSSATSQFLYGTSTVCAALKARRRQLYKLYVHPRSSSSTRDMEALMMDAQRLGTEVVHVDDSWLPLMDKMAESRPHNGLILEASPLPTSPAASLILPLTPADADGPVARTFGVLHHKAKSAQSELRYQTDGWRHPFVLLVDDVLDPGNFGAIIRSAYFLGVDAVAFARHTCAPLSNVALKASAGAAEAMPLLSVDEPRSFLAHSKENGWTVYAAVTPGEDSGDSGQGVAFTHANSALQVEQPHVPLAAQPCILVLGGEGRGLKKSLRVHADFYVSMRAAPRAADIGFDSLNVSVATAVLAAEFMRKPDRMQWARLGIQGTSNVESQADSELGF